MRIGAQQGIATVNANGTWQDAVVSIEATVNYNVLALHPVERDPNANPLLPQGTLPHHVVSAWALK